MNKHNNVAKRIIPCLDIKEGRVVKGINFNDLVDAGDPLEQAKIYNQQLADELVFLDISATNEKRKTLVELVDKIASHLHIPFTVGGGVQSVEDVKILTRSGADKVSINSAAVKNPSIIRKSSLMFGSQCIVLAIDAKKHGAGWNVYTHGGTRDTGKDVLAWAKQGVELGAGELLVTSMDADGTKQGADLDLYQALNKIINVPLIASGGIGTKDHVYESMALANADAVLAASIFHFQEINIIELKKYLTEKNIFVRQ